MISLFGSYFLWHYTAAFRELYTHVKNSLWFFYHFFSLPVLVKTFFQPWKRMEERYPKGLDVGGIASTFIINTMMRAIGVIMRVFLIAIAVIFIAIVFCLGVASFFVWFAIPWLTLIVLISGARLLFI